jgi:YD repeat-containing protein
MVNAMTTKRMMRKTAKSKIKSLSGSSNLLHRLLKISLSLLVLVMAYSMPACAQSSDGSILQEHKSNDITGTTDGADWFGLIDGRSTFYNYNTFTAFPSQVSKTIKNIVSLSIKEESSKYINADFTASVTVNIDYGHTNSNYSTISKTLTVNYKKAEGQKFNASQYISFDGFEYVKVTIANGGVNAPILGSLDTRDVLLVQNKMILKRYLELSPTVTFDNNSFSAAANTPDELTVSWGLDVPNMGNNTTQLEWAWLDNEMEQEYYDNNQLNLKKLFNSSSTRVDLPESQNSYKIPLLYDAGQNGGKLYYRIRAANVKPLTGTTSTGEWTDPKYYSFPGHNNDLNWQATTTFAEEGKRKSVIQYYDGSLRGRQTVTKDNSTNTVVTAETMYDREGRPVIQILPTPGISSVIQYQKNLNLFNGQLPDTDPSDIFDLEPVTLPATMALSTVSGTSQYYSPQNPNNTGINKNIPDAEGYPYTITRYMPDATGRIMTQSGVGAAHQIGTGHETKYYYGTPAQEELDGLFGTDVGNFTHYSKNMVKDANGQVSVSYVDMHGRTIATALAGNAPANLQSLNAATDLINYPGQQGTAITRNLLDNSTNVIKDNSIESVSTILVVKDNTPHTFNYGLTNLQLQLANCPSVQPANLCYDCLYDLEIKITNDNDESAPMIRKYTNISLNPDDDCTTPALPFTAVAGNDALAGDISTANGVTSISFVKTLNTGSYTVRKTLSINEASFQKYKDKYLSKAICKTEQQLIDSVYSILLTTSNCANPATLTCESCKTALGNYLDFRNAFLASIGVAQQDSANYVAEIHAAYDAELANCNKLCTNISQTLPTIRQMMLQDMLPYTGQYAVENASSTGPVTMHNKYNIFAAPGTAFQPYYKNPVKIISNVKTKDYYYNDQNAVDAAIHPDPANLYSYLNGLSKADFGNQFNNAWLPALLPHHPEYGRLVYAENNLTESYNWINTYSQTDDYTAALNAGYFTPVTTDAFRLVDATFTSKMNAQISNYQGGGIGMWQLAYGDVKCKTINYVPQRTQCYQSAPNTPPPYAGFTPAQNAQAWKIFRDLYTAKRNDLVNDFIATQVPLPAADEADLLAQGYRLWFPRNNQQVATQNGWAAWWPPANGSGGVQGGPTGDPTAGGNGAGSTAQAYDGRCSSYISRWTATLLQCPALANKSNKDQIIAEITAAMQQVCVKGSDEANPYGSSNVKPSTPNDGSPRSFEEVINSKLAYYNITRDMYCNPFVIEWPKPYGKNPQVTNTGYTGMLDSCTCEQFKKIKAKAQQANINVNNLQVFNAWLLTQYGDTLTAGMFAALQQCSNYVCECTRLQGIVDQYYQAYPTGGFGGCTTPPANLTISSRTGNTPPQYVASVDIDFVSNFESGATDEFIAYISDTANCDSIATCRQNFVNFFNTITATTPPATWSQIEAMYASSCGNGPGVCGNKDYGCFTLEKALCKYKATTNYQQYCTVNDSASIKNSYTAFFNSFYHNTINTPAYLSWTQIDSLYQSSCIETGMAPWPFTLLQLICTINTDSACNERSCNMPIILPQPEPKPRFLNCGFNPNSTRCITCAVFSSHTKEFKEQQFATGTYNYSNAPHFYTGAALTPQQLKENLLYAQFINYRTGFQFSWADYAQAAGSAACNVSNAQYNNNSGALQTVICGSAKPLTDTAGWPQPPAPCERVYTMAINIAQEILKQRRETILAEFTNAYRQKCLATASMETFTVNYQQPEYHYTLYYYDQAGSLVKTVPPKGVRPDFSLAYTNQVKADRANDVLNQRPHQLVTEYRYNSLGQVVAQKTPDAGVSRFWYDRLGRLVVSQNAKQQLINKYSYTLYDDLGRITEVGQKPHTTAMSQAISQVKDDLAAWINTTGGTKEEITRTVYDLEYNPTIYTQLNLRNRVSYTTITKQDGQGFYAGSFYSYDIHGNVDVLKQNYFGVDGLSLADKTKEMTYEYDLISGKVNRVNYQPGKADAFYHKYTYDAENRIIDVQTSRDDIRWESDAQYSYYKHGPLSRTVIGGQQVQGIDYAYTIQGWIKGINSTAVTPTSAGASFDIGQDGVNGSIVARDIYGYALHYFDNGGSTYDYKPIGAATSTFARPNAGSNMLSLYNGNIAAMTVNNAGLKKGAPASTNSLPLFNRYHYDQLNRIVSMRVYKGLNENSNIWGDAPQNFASIQDYSEDVSYDPNGNIITYIRKGDAARLNMDNMKYWYYYYDNNGVKQQYNPANTPPVNLQSYTNQLAMVEDLATDAGANYSSYNDIKQGQANNNYTYDAIGNLTSDVSEGISNIAWTVYGKIESITKTNGTTVSYGYDAGGNRISKTVSTGGTDKITLYVRDASGNVMSIYENTTGTMAQIETHLYGSSRLGQAGKLTVPPTNPESLGGGSYAIISTFTRGEKLYELSNHLGNVMATITDRKIAFDADNNGNIDYYEADVATASDYYPFGMQMPSRKYNATSEYRYGFNGQEKSDEVSPNSTTAEYWQYDARLGRRWNVDPKGKEAESAYLCFSGNPLFYSDIKGDTTQPTTDAQGNFTGQLNQNFSFQNDGSISQADFASMQNRFLGNLQQQVSQSGRTVVNQAGVRVPISLSATTVAPSLATSPTITVTFGATGISNTDMARNAIYISLADMNGNANVATHEWLHSAGLMDRYYEIWGIRTGSWFATRDPRRSDAIAMGALPPGPNNTQYDAQYNSMTNMMSNSGNQITDMQWGIVFGLSSTGVSERSMGVLGVVSFTFTYSTNSAGTNSNNRDANLGGLRGAISRNSGNMSFTSQTPLLGMANVADMNFLNSYIIHNMGSNILGPTNSNLYRTVNDPFLKKKDPGKYYFRSVFDNFNR